MTEQQNLARTIMAWVEEMDSAIECGTATHDGIGSPLEEMRAMAAALLAPSPAPPPTPEPAHFEMPNPRQPLSLEPFRYPVKRSLAPAHAPTTEVIDRITEYLSLGGNFNPEFMEHDKVRVLLIDAREALAPAPGRTEMPKPINGGMCVNGCQKPISPPSLVICRDCMDRIGRNLRALAEGRECEPDPRQKQGGQEPTP